MKYKLDINGYVESVFWGCYTGTCQEYSGTVPTGYETLPEWADNALINAYYIDEAGNLALDSERERELRTKIEQQTRDYAPVLRRELYETEEILDSQYVKATANGKFITLEDVKNIPPTVGLTDIKNGSDITIFAHSKNMLPIDIQYEYLPGLDIINAGIGGLRIEGHTNDGEKECTISGANDNTTPLFALLADEEYYLNIGNFTCEMLYYDGETTEQIYSGGSGIITLPENKKATEVKLIFPAGEVYEEVVYVTLNPGSEPIEEFEAGKTKTFTFPLEPITDLSTAEVTITGGMVILHADNNYSVVHAGNVSLHNGNNLIYTDQGNVIGMEYSTTGLTGSVGGWKIDGNALYCDIIPPGDYTKEDITKIENAIAGNITLTDEEKEKYDMDGDGRVGVLDLLHVNKLVVANISKSKPGKLLFDTSDYNNPIKLLDGDGNKLVTLGPFGLDPNPISKQGDYVIEQGTEGIWTYRKWNSGIAECWGRLTETKAHYATLNGFYAYYGYMYFPQNLFISAPHTQYCGKIGRGFSLPSMGARQDGKNQFVYYFLSSENGTQSVSVEAYSVGRWI